MSGWGIFKRRHFGIAGGILMVAVVAHAQDGSGIAGYFSLSSGISISDNPDFVLNGSGDTRLRNDLGFGLSGETHNQTFEFNAGAGLEFGSDISSGENVTAPFANFKYARESRNARLTANLSYSELDASNSFVDDSQDPLLFDPNELILDTGTRQRSNQSVGFEFGRAAPFGGEVSLTRARLSYSGTTNPSLLNTDTKGANLSLRFDIDPRISARGFVNTSDREVSGDGTDRKALSYGVGAVFDMTRGRSLDAQLGYDRVELTGGPIATPINTTQNGITYSLGVTQDMPNGTLAGTFGSTIGDSGRRTSVEMTRALELRNGSLSAAVGLSKTEGISGSNPIFRVNYATELPQGALRVGLSQSVGSSNDSVEVRNTQLSLGFDHQLTATSSLNAGLTYRKTSSVGSSSSTANTSRTDLSISYRREVVKDWDLNGSYTYSTTQDTSSNTLFLGLAKRFDWRP